MKCDIKIYGIETRRENVIKLQSDCGLDDNDIKIIPKNGKFPWAYLTKWAFLEPFEEGITHRCILQDDSEVCPEFTKYLDKVVNAVPDALVFLTADEYKEKDEFVESMPSPYIYKRIYCNGNAIVMPTKHLKECVEWIEKKYPNIADGDPHEDYAILTFAQYKGMPVITTVPSLVQHNGVHSSLFNWDSDQRTYYFKDWDKANWDNGIVNMYKHIDIKK